MKKILIFLISIYQKSLSPDHGWFKHQHPYGYCKFYPSCSEYTKLAISRHGSIKGLVLGTKRIIKCNPWVEPKVDIVPN